MSLGPVLWPDGTKLEVLGTLMLLIVAKMNGHILKDVQFVLHIRPIIS